MNRRQLGRTDMFVNEVGYGSMSLAINPGVRPSETEAINVLQRAVDEYGVEFIDTADSYCTDENDIGYGERLIAKALTGERRQRVVIATKGGFARPDGAWVRNGHPDHLRSACEQSLAALGTDVIDLYQFHLPDPNVPIEESLGAIIDMKNEGKIRHIGVSNFNLEQLKVAVEMTEITSLQNPLAPMFYNGEREALLEFCENNGISWIAYGPLGGHRRAYTMIEYAEWMRGHVSPANAEYSVYSLLLAWSLGVSPAVIPIPATTKLEHLAENMHAASIQLTSDEVTALRYPQSWREQYYMAREGGDYQAAITKLQTGLGFVTPQEFGPLWYDMACTHALAGEEANALNAFERAIELGFNHADHARQDTDLESLQLLPRFQALLEKMEAASANS
jgi:aryl-alcohol dehydrogenase-like predicted oxidoreductase